MKIESINVQNVLGIQRFEIDQAKPITLVAGGNEAGKSSLIDAISMAMTGKPRRVSLKKDMGQLVHDGAKKGIVVIGMDGGQSASFKLPKGEHEAPAIEAAEFLPLVLDAEAFSSLSDDERRKALFKLTGCSAKPAYIMAELEGAGCDAELSKQIIGISRAGFTAMHDEAKQRATQAKGEWKAITGENWGSDKAEGWEVEIVTGPAVTRPDVETAKTEADKIQRDIENGMAHQGKLQAQIETAQRVAEQNAAGKEKQEMLPRLRAKMEATKADLESWAEKLENSTASLAGDDTYVCPCCDENLQLLDGKLIKAGKGLSVAERKELKEQHAKAADAVELLKRTLNNDTRAVQEAENVLLAEECWPVDGELERTIDAINKLRTNLAAAQAKHAALADRFAMLSGVNDTNAKAAEAHERVKAWLAIAEQLSPGGIPLRLLAKAINPINEQLAMLAGVAKWKVATIDADMGITYGGRAMALCSESGKWRCNVMLQLAIATLSGIKLAVIDRFDVLEIAARQKFCALADNLVKTGLIDSIIVCGTLKEAPRMPANWQSLWLANGKFGA